MTPPILKTKNLCQKSGNNYLFKNIDWEISSGENWLLYGETGCGKTSLLSTIAGLNVPSSGEIYFCGEQYTAENISHIKKQISLVSGSFFDNIFRRETALEIILSGINGGFSVPYEVSAADIRHAKGLLTKLRMPEIINHPYDLLSKGQKECILLARGFMHKPKLLIFDEPTAGLDLLLRTQIINTISKLCADQTISIVFVTHDAAEISTDFEQCLIMRHGQIYERGLTAEILNEDFFCRYFQHKMHFSWANNSCASIQIPITSSEQLIF